MSNSDSAYYVSYGPAENCTLATCDTSLSVYQYQPSLAANAIFIALFGVSLIIHIVQGLRYKTWTFTIAIFWGCVAEMVGYGGRIILHNNPFSFTGFIAQIGKLTAFAAVCYLLIIVVCITVAPAFYSAAIYVTLSQM